MALDLWRGARRTHRPANKPDLRSVNPAELSIRREHPDQPEVRALLAALDAYLAGLYAPEHNHTLDVVALVSDEVDFLVARHAGVAVACAAARAMPGEPDSGGKAYGEIKRMYVDPAWRGQRLAERLLAQLEAGLLARGLSLALLETGRDQLEAVRLYQRCGYCLRGNFGGYPDNGLSAFYFKPL